MLVKREFDDLIEVVDNEVVVLVWLLLVFIGVLEVDLVDKVEVFGDIMESEFEIEINVLVVVSVIVLVVVSIVEVFVD